MKARTVLTAAVLAAALGTVGACATATPYQPNVRGQAVSGGYSDYRVGENRYRVSFAGNNLTSRDTVERYLLYRAAELTVQSGHDWFLMADRQTDRTTRTYVEPDPTWRYGYWRPYWRYYGRGWGWRTWDPFWGDPFWADRVDVRTVEKYEAMAEIVMYRGAPPSTEVRAFNARDVIANLEPTIVRPAP